MNSSMRPCDAPGVRPVTIARRITAIWALVLLLLTGCATETVPPVEGGAARPTRTQRMDEAKAASDAGDYQAAVEMFQDILSTNPTYVPAYVGIGDVYLTQRAYEQAEPAYRRAARLDPLSFDAQFGHGLSLHGLSRYAEAVRKFHRSLALQPEDVPANTAIATSYLRLDKPESALVFAEKAVELDPENGPARSNLGAIYELLGRNTDAVEQYLAAMELMPPAPPLMLNLINTLARERRYQEVINAAENLIKIEQSADAYERMGYAYFRLADYEKSRESYRKAVDLDPDHWQSLNGIGVNALNEWLLSQKRDLDAAVEARDAFRRSVRINPNQRKVIALLSNYQL